MTHQCKKCAQVLSHEHFYKDKRMKTGHRNTCKACDRDVERAKSQQRTARAMKHYYRNRDAVLARARAWKAANKERISLYNRAYDITFPDIRMRANTKRRKREHLAIPPWYDEAEVRAIYLRCREITKSTGIKHQVDHVIPLCNDLVCGLHVHTNMQIITKSDNLRKGNDFEVT